MNDISEITQEIASKKNWYEKIFDQDIITKWKSEHNLKNEDLAKFDLAVKLLRASVQGIKHSDDCRWDINTVCEECVAELKEQLIDEGDSEIDFNDPNWYDQYYDYGDDCEHIKCSCIGPDIDLYKYIEYHSNLIPNDLHQECKRTIKNIMDSEPIDWHPGSNNQVRDLIHPSLYCYVKDKERDSVDNYQWLPSEFKIHEESVECISYINNLDEKKYPDFIPVVEKIFAKYLTSLERVIKKKLKNRNIQVIVKVASHLLTPEKPNYGAGKWHLEGIPEEYIVATVLHYVDMDNINNSYLEFRKPTIINEMNLDYPQSDANYTSHHYGLKEHFDGVMNRHLGLIRCKERAGVVFPNTLQHRVKEFSSTKSNLSATRTILAFFVIDPDHRITSTKDVPPQQLTMTREKAEKYRERLMLHRSFYVDTLNEEVFEREYSLCEH